MKERWTIGLILLLCLAPEVVARTGLPGVWSGVNGSFLRQQIYQYTAFWPGLLENWRPNYLGQQWLMFFTYGFVHAGLLHLLVNMLTLVTLGRAVLQHTTAVRFLVIYFVSQIGGAIGYALVSTRPLPMVGASGALFGLAGALLLVRFKEDLALLSRFQTARDIFPPLLLLVFYNVVMFWALDGRLAWETHLGGFIAGVLAAAAVNAKSVK